MNLSNNTKQRLIGAGVAILGLVAVNILFPRKQSAIVVALDDEDANFTGDGMGIQSNTPSPVHLKEFGDFVKEYNAKKTDTIMTPKVIRIV